MSDQIESGSERKDLDFEIRKLLNKMLSDSAFKGKRSELAARLSTRSRSISCAMLNAFVAHSGSTAYFPAALILPLSEIIGDDRLQRLVMGPRLCALLEYAEKHLAGFHNQRELDALRDSLLQGLFPHCSRGGSR